MGHMKNLDIVLRNGGQEAVDAVSRMAADIEAMVPRWIPVSERKPDCDRVLLSDGRNVTIATRYANGAYDAWDVWEKMPTHWMPIPEPPG